MQDGAVEGSKWDPGEASLDEVETSKQMTKPNGKPEVTSKQGMKQ